MSFRTKLVIGIVGMIALVTFGIVSVGFTAYLRKARALAPASGAPVGTAEPGAAPR